jgi:hypothetical protein
MLMKLMVGVKSSLRNARKTISLIPPARINFRRRLLMGITAGQSPTLRSGAALFKVTTDQVAAESAHPCRAFGRYPAPGSGLKFFAIFFRLSSEYRDETNYGWLLSSPSYMINLSFHWTLHNTYGVIVTL